MVSVIDIWISVMIMSQHPDNRETGYSNVLHSAQQFYIFFALLVKPTLNSVLNVWKHLSVVEQYPSVRACSAFWKIFFVFRTFSITLDSLDPRPILQLRNEKYCNNGEFPS